MSDFNYRAIDKQGKAKKGTIDAKDEEAVKSKLKADGLTVIEITKANAFNKDININIGGGVSSRDLSVFCRQFTSMINAGVTIMDTLDMLGEQTENKTMAKAIRGVHSEIQKGETLYSLRAFPIGGFCSMEGEDEESDDESSFSV